MYRREDTRALRGDQCLRARQWKSNVPTRCGPPLHFIGCYKRVLLHVMSCVCLGPNWQLGYEPMTALLLKNHVPWQKPMFISMWIKSVPRLPTHRRWTRLCTQLKNQANSPCSPAATAKVRRPLVVAGEDLVGVHPSAHLAVSAPVVLSLVLQKVAFYHCYFELPWLFQRIKESNHSSKDSCKTVSNSKNDTKRFWKESCLADVDAERQDDGDEHDDDGGE